MTGSETATAAPPRAAARLAHGARRRSGSIVVSTAIRFAAAQAFSTPWIAPDEMVYGMLGEGLWSHGTLTLRSFPSPYYSLLTPALIGAPLAALDLARRHPVGAAPAGARDVARRGADLPLGAPDRVGVVGRRRRRARARVARCSTTPGFLMTEPLTLTVVTVALLMLARALEEPSMWRYGVFVAWATAAAAVRLQALVLLPAFLLAARRRLGRGTRPHAPAAAPLVRGARRCGVRTRRRRRCSPPARSSRRGGCSARTRRSARRRASAPTGCDEVAWHAFDVSVLGLGVTVLASAALAWIVLSRRDTDPALRAFVSTRARVHGAPRRPGRAVRRRLRRHDRRALPRSRCCRCSRSACARGSRAGAPRALAVVLPVWALDRRRRGHGADRAARDARDAAERPDARRPHARSARRAGPAPRSSPAPSPRARSSSRSRAASHG